MNHLKNITILAALLLIISSCHKDPPKQYDETDMTITFYNTDFSFSSYTNFIMPDSTVLKTKIMTESEVAKLYEDGGISEQTLQILEDRFTALGYHLVDSLADADFIALPTILMMQQDQQIWYNPGWWWGYPGGYYPYYYSFSTGTLFITMGDPNNPIVDGDEVKFPVVWGGAFNGMLSSSTSDMNARIKRSIDQAFSQSKCFHK